MAILAADMVKNVLLGLNEQQGSPAGSLGTATDATEVISTDTAIKGYLSDGGNLIAMTCIPFLDTFTGTLASGAIYTLAHQLTPVGGSSQLWLPRAVKINGVPLQFIGRDVLEIFNPGLATAAPGTPKYWFFDGGEIGTDVPMVADATLDVEGFATPNPFSVSVTTWDWLPDRDHVLPEWYAEVMLAYKNLTDGQLGPRAVSCAHQFDVACQTRWASLPALSRRFAYPRAPIPLLMALQQSGG